MSLSNFGTGTSSTQTPQVKLGTGKHDGIIHAIIEVGEHKTFYNGKENGVKPQVKVLIEIPGVGPDGASIIKGVKAMNIPLGISEKSHLVKLLFAAFNINEEAELQSLISKKGVGPVFKEALGKPVTFLVKEFSTADDRDLEYIVKDSFIAFDDRLPALESSEEPFLFMLDAEDTVSVFNTKLSNYTKVKEVGTAENRSEFSVALQQAIAEAEEEKSTEDKVLG